MGDEAKHWRERITEPGVRVESGVRAKVGGELAPLEGLRLLWIDPDHACTERCRAMLAAWGAVIVVVDDPATGLDTVAATNPDVVVISGDTKACSADQLARVLHFVIPEPPPVVLVTRRDLRGFDGALPGVVRLLPRPCHPRALLDVLRRVERA